MMKKIFLGIGVIAMVLLSTANASSEVSQQSADTAIATAEARYGEAVHANVAWRKTHEFIAKAKVMSKEAKYQEAIDLANRAKLEADLALQESAEYDKTWQAVVVK